ncbi:N-alpha-acetyltransferase 38, NatC auxiliary subunit [Protobothrops mucrosquamatus]|uniref:N-alpha-acetyltransferase 38, NatC auxiliary subunit n=1 Tax=Protobothrops mucrosquamatus TaxID=103944 RepID=UPI000775A97E|nr:N-alpha-acetyltransferase 38, NatC auxiliary subunit [Protobothrops mucrosquamatus]
MAAPPAQEPMLSQPPPPPLLPRESDENGCGNSAPEDPVEETADSPYLRARRKLENLLNKSLRIRMTDGRTLVGCFLCTDRDCNVILGSAQEYLKPTEVKPSPIDFCFELRAVGGPE